MLNVAAKYLFPLNVFKQRYNSVEMGVQPKFLGKLGLEIGVYQQKTTHIGGSFGEVSESLHLLRSALVH